MFKDLIEIIRHNVERTGRSGCRSFWNYRIVDRGGRLLEAHAMLGNIWHDDGEEFLVKVAFSEEVAVPANYYLGLDARTSLAEADALTTIGGTEPSGNGYARQAVASDNVAFTAAQSGGDWQVTTQTKTFTASGGNWGTLKNIFMTDQVSAQTGKYLICSRALSTDRTINDGDSLQASLVISVKEAA